MLSSPGRNLAQQKGVGVVAPLLCMTFCGAFLGEPLFWCRARKRQGRPTLLTGGIVSGAEKGAIASTYLDFKTSFNSFSFSSESFFWRPRFGMIHVSKSSVDWKVLEVQCLLSMKDSPCSVSLSLWARGLRQKSRPPADEASPCLNNQEVWHPVPWSCCYIFWASCQKVSTTAFTCYLPASNSTSRLYHSCLSVRSS
jgi:hypothetical protein